MDLSEEELEKNKKTFISLLKETKRENIEALLEFLEKYTDFYTAPASTKYHGNFKGGLLLHSMKVYQILVTKVKQYTYKKEFVDLSDETLRIVALLHDICKVNYYKESFKNAKNEKGEWEKVPIYIVDDTIPYGHGEKSVMMISEYIKLSSEEKYVIRWHMGFTEAKENYSTIAQAYKKYPLGLLLHEADLEATYFFNI